MAMKEMYFFHFFVFELFSTYACMLMSFFHVFFWLLNQRSGSQPLRRNSKRLLIASHDLRRVLSRERMLR